MLRSPLAFFLLILAPAAAAQQERLSSIAFTSQSFQHDVRAVAMGDASAFLPDAAPLSFVQNPARLAEASVTPMLRVAGHTFQDFSADIHHAAATGSVGVVAVGVAVSRLNQQSQTFDGSGELISDGRDGDTSVLVGSAVRIGDARAHLDLGAAGRLTRLDKFTQLTVGSSEVQLTQMRPSLDLGAIATYNVLPPAGQIRVGEFAPSVAASVGYTQRAIGPRFEFDLAVAGRADTLRLSQPRQASLGISAQFGLDAQYAGGRLRLASLDLAAEAVTRLNRVECSFAAGEPQSVCEENNATLLGDIRPQDALLGTSDDARVDGQRGARLTLAETVWIAVGGLVSGTDRSRYSTQSWGVGLSVGGALRAIGTLQDDDGAHALGERLGLTIGIARVSDDAFSDGPFYKLISVGGAVRL